MEEPELLQRYAKGQRDFRGFCLRGADLHEANLPGVNPLGSPGRRRLRRIEPPLRRFAPLQSS